MAVAQPAEHRVVFSTVENGWDPAEVLSFIDELESRVRAVGAGLHRVREVDARRPEQALLAEAEHGADEIVRRAMLEASTARRRAADDARSGQIQARRDALRLIESSRKLADEIVASARSQEAGVYDRVRTLRRVVRRTEKLLRSVAAGQGEGQAVVTVPDAQATGGDFHVVLAADGPSTSETPSGDRARIAEAIPEPVRSLLEQLRHGGADGH